MRHRLLAGELRRLRADAALTGPTVAKDLGWSTAKFSRMESALIRPSPSDVQALIDYYGVPSSEQGTFIQLARQATQRNWWDQHVKALPDSYIQYIGLEHEAKSVVNWEMGVMPGLLQVDAYMDAVNSVGLEHFALPPGALRLRRQVRSQRQELLTGPDPLELIAIFDEAVLLRPVGGPALMRSQLDHLVKMAKLPNVTIQVLELSKPYPLLGAASLTQLRFGPDESLGGLVHPEVTYAESLLGGSFIYAEDETHQHNRMMQHLIQASLGPEESIRLIREAAAKLAD
ncbi:helix-turn-helix transcriptional regulator [Nonomuraea sp. NPDC049158]|uniref:helix-turn-helix domain-containing protein n=1 Tax=Nonomuraea sp. NPDC049158 TaxID=3155649 RepID=UPI003403C167